jgi:thioredoxin 1
MSIYEIENKNILNKMIDACEEANKLLIIKVSAVWCGPCQAVKPKYKELAEQYPNTVFTTFDVDAQEELAELFNISSMPTFIVIKDRNIIKRSEGADLFSIKFILEQNYNIAAYNS